MVSHVSSSSVYPSHRIRYSMFPRLFLELMISATSYWMSSSSIFICSCFLKYAGLSSNVCITLCNRDFAGSSTSYACLEMTFDIRNGPIHLFTKDRFPLIRKFLLSTYTISSRTNCRDLSMCNLLRLSLILLRVSWICLCIVTILFSHSSAAGDPISSFSSSKCTAFGFHPYSAKNGEYPCMDLDELYANSAIGRYLIHLSCWS